MNVIKKRITLEKLLNKINMVFLVILIVIIMVWSDYDAFYLLPVFLVMLAFLFRLNGAAAEKEKKFLIPVTVFAFLLRVNLTLLLYLVSKYAGNHGFWSFAIDSQYYFEAGSKLSAFWSGGPPVKVDVFNTYVYFVAFVYWLFSPKLILTSLFNAFFGTVSVVLLYFISRYLFAHTGRRAVEGITLLAAMFPSFVLWSTQTLKDPLVVLLLLLFVLFFLQYFSDRRVVWMLSAGVTVNLLAGVRNYTAVILVAAVFLNLLVMYLRLREGLDRKKLLLDVSLIGTCVMAIFLSKFGTSIVQSLLQTNLQSIQSMRENVYAIGNTGITEGDVSSPAGALKYLPLGLAYVFLAPFPDMWLIGRGFIEKLAAPDMLAWYLLLLGAVRGLVIFLRRAPRHTLFLLIFVALLAIPYALVIGNVGAIYRLRFQFQPVIFLLGVPGLLEISQRIFVVLSGRI